MQLELPFSATSAEAFDSVQGVTGELRRRVYDIIKRSGLVGMTSDDVEETLGLSHQTVSARCTELKKRGLVIESGRRRPTRSGRNAAVLIVKE